jgi:hypothetical protein
MQKFKIFLLLIFSLFSIHYSLFTRAALAHCPLCVAGAAAGVTLTRWVGVDDAITGVWLAALLGAMAFWSESLIKKRELRPILRPFIYLAIFGLTIWSFYKFQLVIRMSQIFGLDKLTFGMITGGILFYLVDLLDDLLIRKTGKVFFPYQRIVVSLGSILVWSLVIYILLNFYI